ncbi:DMT family transporter [Stappia sediminis]|nr:DMT family transporter [Stappia sediminis]
MSAPATDTVSGGNLKGALLLMLAGAVFTGEVMLVRLAGETAATAQIVFFRALAQLLLGTAMVVASRGAFATHRPFLQVTRGLTSLGVWYLYYVSFLLLDLALASTLTFSTSLFVTLLAARVLGERIGMARWAATLIGFAGVVIASGASSSSVEPGVLVGIASAALAAVLVLLNRILVRTEKTPTIMFYIGVVTTLGTLPVAWANWQPLSGEVFTLLTCAGLVGASGMWLTIEAYRAGEVSALAPFPYLRLVFAVAAGYAVFAEVPSANTLAGMAVIVATTIYVARSERRRGLAAPHR